MHHSTATEPPESVPIDAVSSFGDLSGTGVVVGMCEAGEAFAYLGMTVTRRGTLAAKPVRDSDQRG